MCGCIVLEGSMRSFGVKKMSERNCRECDYFLNCLENGNQESPYCERYPGAKGFCELWNGPLNNYNPCTGWVPMQRRA